MIKSLFFFHFSRFNFDHGMDAAFGEFRHVRESLREEIEGHEQTKVRLAHHQQLMETVTKVASSGVDEFNQLKRAYASEVALRKDYEQRLTTISPGFTPASAASASSSALEDSHQKAMAENISNVYLLPTLTGQSSFPASLPPCLFSSWADCGGSYILIFCCLLPVAVVVELGERLERSEYELAQSTQRANVAENNLDKIQAAASLALAEFSELKKKYTEEVIRRQEAEKVALESRAGDIKLAPSTGTETAEQLRRQLETEKQLRKLAENDVANITKQMNEKQGKQFDLMTVTELECKLESALKSLDFAKENLQKSEAEREDLEREVADLQTRAGISVGRAPPPPPPPPIFTTVPTSDNLKKKIGVLKEKLKGGEQKDDKLSKSSLPGGNMDSGLITLFFFYFFFCSRHQSPGYGRASGKAPEEKGGGCQV